MHFARIIISTEDEACIHISIITPVDPEFRIVNSSQHEIMVNQLKRPEVVVPPMTTIPWAFDDLQEAKKVEMQFKQDKKVYEIEKIGKCKKLGNNSVSVNVKGVTRELRIIPVGASFQKIKLEKVKEKQGYQFIASLAGVGLSIIDRTPSEVFYLSFQYLTVKFTTKSQKVKNEIRNQMKIDLKLRTIQLDNMQAGNRLFPILFTPLANKDNEDTPFFQVRIHKINTSKESSSEISSIDKYSWFEVSVQEMQIQVNQEVTTILLNMMTALDKIYGNKLDHKKFANVTSLKEVCLYLDASSPILSYNPSQASKKIFFEFFHLCAVKIYVSFKAGKRDIDFQLDPMQGFGLFRALFSIGSAFTNISESPLRFRELIIKESFQTMSNLS